MSRERSIGTSTASTASTASAVSAPGAVGKRTRVEGIAPAGVAAPEGEDGGDYGSEVGQHVRELRAWDDAAIAARRAELQGRLATTKEPKARERLVHEYEAIEWVARERGLALPKDPREAAAPQGFMGGKPVKFWAPGDPRGMRALLEREMASGAGYEAAKGDALARVNYATPSRSPADQATWKVGQDQAALMDQDAAAFRAAFQAEAKREALAMLSASTAAIDAALRSYGIAGGDFRLTEAARKVAHDPGALDAEVANWVALSHHLDRNKPALAAGHGRRDELAREAERLRGLQDSIALLSAEQHRLVSQLGTDCVPRASTRPPKIESLAPQPAAPAGPFATPKPAAQSPQQQLAFVQGALQARQAQFRAAWLEAERAHPVLAAYRGRHAPDARVLPGRGTDDDTLHSILRQVVPKLANIYRTKAALQGGALDPLQLAPVVELTKHRMFVAEGSYRDRAVHDMAAHAHERHGGLIGWALDAVMIGLTLLTLVPTGGASAMLAVSLTGLAYDLHAGLDDYASFQLTSAATDTDLDAFHSLSNADPSLAPLVLRLVSAGVNLSVATGLIQRAIAVRRLARQGVTDADAVARLNQAGEQLGVAGIGDESAQVTGRSATSPTATAPHTATPTTATPSSPTTASAPTTTASAPTAATPAPTTTTPTSTTTTPTPTAPAPTTTAPAPTTTAPAPTTTAPAPATTAPAPATTAPAPATTAPAPATTAPAPTTTAPAPTQAAPAAPTTAVTPTPTAVPTRATPRASIATSSASGTRINEPVPGLYDGLDPDFKPPGWRIEEPDPIGPHPKHPELIQITTNVTGPNGNTGWIQRSYDPKKKMIVMENAFLQHLPSWIDAGVPLVPGRGSPTVTYLTLRQMRLLGAHFGELQTIKMSTIQNVEAVMQLEQLARQGMSLDAAVAKTHSVAYATTSIEQSGHTIVDIRIDTSRTWRWQLKAMMDRFKTDAKRRQELFTKYGLTESDNVLVNYDILIDLAPHPAGH